MKIVFIIPCYNASQNLLNLATSLMSQNDDRWSAIVIDDISTDDTWNVMNKLNSNRFSIIKNNDKKYALKNIVEQARKYEKKDDIIIATIDGDDQLCNDDAVSLIIDEYKKGFEVVWTAQRWDISDSVNVSKAMPSNVNPYFWPWSSSHLRTFKSTLLNDISDDNFKNIDGIWFERGYDQALMLPILYKTDKRKYVDKICYLYNIDSSSIPEEKRDWCEIKQIATINLVRARGFIE